MSTHGTVDYAAVLADLREQRARLDVAIRALEALEGERTAGTGALAAEFAPRGATATDFAGMTVYEAAIKHLQSTKQGQRTTQILRALQLGGVAFTGKSPINTLGAILNSSLKRHSEIVKLRRGVWGLAAWSTPPQNEPMELRLDGSAKAQPLTPPSRPMLGDGTTGTGLHDAAFESR